MLSWPHAHPSSQILSDCALPHFCLAPFRTALTLLTPELKKSRTDPDDFSNICPISIFYFLLNQMSNTVAIQPQAHMSKTNYGENFSLVSEQNTAQFLAADMH